MTAEVVLLALVLVLAHPAEAVGWSDGKDVAAQLLHRQTVQLAMLLALVRLEEMVAWLDGNQVVVRPSY